MWAVGRYAATNNNTNISCGSNQIDQDRVGHLEDKAQYLGTPHPTSGTALFNAFSVFIPLLLSFAFICQAHINPSGRFPALISHNPKALSRRGTPREIAVEADHQNFEPQPWRSQFRPMQSGSTITLITIVSMRKSLVASSLKNGEKATDTTLRYVAVMRLHAICIHTDLAWRKGDEFRFWIPRPLDKVGFIQFFAKERLQVLIFIGGLLG